MFLECWQFPSQTCCQKISSAPKNVRSTVNSLGEIILRVQALYNRVWNVKRLNIYPVNYKVQFCGRFYCVNQNADKSWTTKSRIVLALMNSDGWFCYIFTIWSALLFYSVQFQQIWINAVVFIDQLCE